MIYTIKHIEENNMIIFSSIMGSKAYGTSLPNSDTDIRGIFIQPLQDIFRYGYIDQVSDEKNDIVYYELKRFLELVQKNNPNILELLNAPEDVIQYKHPIYDLISEHTKDFVTKQCRHAFAGYAETQIKKASGYNKKMHWEEAKMERKNVLDYCYILEYGKSIPLLKWLSMNGELTYDDFGLANIDHAHDVYAMYRMYDDEYSGIVKDPDKSNNVQLVSVPKGKPVIAYLTFNKDAYSLHCKRYSEYQTWLKNRNVDRVKMNKEHGKQYDSKNLMHTYRLLNMSLEIAKTGEINVRRSPEEIEHLMKIRRGEYEYDDLVNDAKNLVSKLDEAFDKSNLPSNVENYLIQELESKIRTEWYQI